MDDFFVEFSVASPNDNVGEHPNLRRELQTVTCRAVSPHTLTSRTCPSSYPCTCTGSTETSCAYCELETTRGHVCVVTDSITTFVQAQTSQMKSCSCQYANGRANLSCNDLMNRAQTAYPEGTTYPVPIPPSTVPPTTPTPVPPYTLPPTTPSPVPPYQPPTSSSPALPYQTPVFACHADMPQNKLSNDCSGTYSCMCGTTATMCPYCQVDTRGGHYCFGTGSTMTFQDPVTAAMTTCSCDVVNGVPQEICHVPPSTTVATLPPYDSNSTTTTTKKSKGETRRRRLH